MPLSHRLPWLLQRRGYYCTLWDIKDLADDLRTVASVRAYAASKYSRCTACAHSYILVLFLTAVAGVGVVSMLYNAKAQCGDGPFYDEAREELVWADIEGRSINFLNVNTRTNHSIQLMYRVGAAIPCKDDDSKLIAVSGRDICLVDRETGK